MKKSTPPAPKEQTLSDYRKKLRRLAKEESSEIFYNTNEEHAIIVLMGIVENAKQYIKTICGNLCTEVLGNDEYLRMVDTFLSSDSTRTYDVLFDNFSKDFYNKGIYKVLVKYPKQVKLRKLADEDTHVFYEGNPIHMTVSDDKMFRMETNIEEKAAWGCFNGPTKAQAFRSSFDRLFNNTEQTEPIEFCCV